MSKFVDDFDVSGRKQKIGGFVASNFPRVFVFGKIRIPKKFNDRYGIFIPRKIVLVMDNGDSWSSLYDHKNYEISGLECFMKFYGVKTYWFIIFHYFGGGKFGVNIFSPKCVEIFYPRILPSCLSINRNEMVDIKVFNNHSFIEERSGALLFFNVAYSGSGVFSFVVQSSHLNEEVGKVVVCEDLYHLLKKFRNVEKITLWLLKTKWEVGIEWYDYHCVLGNGWSLFARDLELCLGDTCIFESTNNALEFNVCVFKREEYDFVMFEPDLHGVKFFQLVMSDSLEGCRIVLPILFGYYLVKSISSVVEFVMPSNQTWSICYEDDPPRFSLLKDFASFYGLRENFVVIFEYIGYSRFFVRIFDQNSVEIVYLKLMKSLGIATDLVKSKNPKGEEGTIKEYFELHDDIYESPNLLLLSKESHVVCEFTVAFFSSEIGEKMQDVYVCNSLETFSGDWINDSVSRFIAHGRQWRVEVKLESNICRFGHGWNEFVRDNDLVAGDICILKLVNFVGRVFKIEISRV